MGEVLAYGDISVGQEPNTWILTPYSYNQPVLLDSIQNPAPSQPTVIQTNPHSQPATSPPQTTLYQVTPESVPVRTVVTSPAPQTYTIYPEAHSQPVKAPIPPPKLYQVTSEAVPLTTVVTPLPQQIYTIYPENPTEPIKMSAPPIYTLVPEPLPSVPSQPPKTYSLVSSATTPAIMAQPTTQTYSIKLPDFAPQSIMQQQAPLPRLILKQPAEAKPPNVIVVRRPTATNVSSQPQMTSVPESTQLIEIKHSAPQVSFPQGPFEIKLAEPINLTGFPTPPPAPTGPQELVLRFAEPFQFNFDMPALPVQPPPPAQRPILLLAQYTCDQEPQLVSVINTETGKPYTLSEKQIIHLKALPHPTFERPPLMGGALMMKRQ